MVKNTPDLDNYISKGPNFQTSPPLRYIVEFYHQNYVDHPTYFASVPVFRTFEMVLTLKAPKEILGRSKESRCIHTYCHGIGYQPYLRMRDAEPRKSPTTPASTPVRGNITTPNSTQAQSRPRSPENRSFLKKLSCLRFHIPYFIIL